MIRLALLLALLSGCVGGLVSGSRRAQDAGVSDGGDR